jgi:hypothetical protein
LVDLLAIETIVTSVHTLLTCFAQQMCLYYQSYRYRGVKANAYLLPFTSDFMKHATSMYHWLTKVEEHAAHSARLTQRLEHLDCLEAEVFSTSLVYVFERYAHHQLSGSTARGRWSNLLRALAKF